MMNVVAFEPLQFRRERERRIGKKGGQKEEKTLEEFKEESGGC